MRGAPASTIAERTHQTEVEAVVDMKPVSACLALAVLVLCGCATVEDAKPQQTPAQVKVYREPSSRDSLFPMLFAVDGRPIAQLQPKDEHSFELQPGEHRFEYELGLYDCSARVRIESGKTYVYRFAQGCVFAAE
jgi:hypothetical protein